MGMVGSRWSLLSRTIRRLRSSRARSSQKQHIGVPSAAEGASKNRSVIAAVNRCATQNQAVPQFFRATMPVMKRMPSVVFTFLVLCFFNCSLSAFAAPRTLRVDYYHTGNSREEWFSMDRVVLERLEWPGNLNKAIDESQLGNYLFEVREKAGGKLLYSRGFNSVFGEWRTTEEALHGNRTFSESLRFPSPNGPGEVLVKERDER